MATAVSVQLGDAVAARAPAGVPAQRDAAPWWALELHGTTLQRGDGSGSERYAAEGELHPILVDALGDPVVAAWTSPSGEQRWYIIPDACDWATILDAGNRWRPRCVLRDSRPG